MDISEKSLEIAHQRTGALGLQEKIRFYQESVKDLRSVVPVEPFSKSEGRLSASHDAERSVRESDATFMIVGAPS